MLSSIPFLMATFFIYGCTNELRNLHGKCLMCYVFGLILLYLSFSVNQLFHNEILQTKWLCKTFGYLAYISILICFLWLNVMCYDIWSTFRFVTNLKLLKFLTRIFTYRRGYGAKGSERRRFFNYCLYAFGVPVFITLMVFLADSLSFVPELLKVQMGENRCFVNDSHTTGVIFVYGPISLVLLLNTIFYSITAFKIHQVQKETSIVRKDESKMHSKKNVHKARLVVGHIFS